jgi:hypothetical protein
MTTIRVARPETLLSGLFVRKESANVTHQLYSCMGWGRGNGKEVEGGTCHPKQPRLFVISILSFCPAGAGATTALVRKQDMKESVDAATATGGDVTCACRRRL